MAKNIPNISLGGGYKGTGANASLDLSSSLQQSGLVNVGDSGAYYGENAILGDSINNSVLGDYSVGDYAMGDGSYINKSTTATYHISGGENQVSYDTATKPITDNFTDKKNKKMLIIIAIVVCGILILNEVSKKRGK